MELEQLKKLYLDKIYLFQSTKTNRKAFHYLDFFFLNT